MERDISIYEFQWWTSFVGKLFILIVAISLIALSVLLYPILTPRNTWRVNVFVFAAIYVFAFTLPSLLRLHSVPRLIRFKEHSVETTDWLNRTKTFRYDQIQQFVVCSPAQWSRPWQWFSTTSFRAVIHFAEPLHKVRFDPKVMPDFKDLVQYIRTKGVHNVNVSDYENMLPPNRSLPP